MRLKKAFAVILAIAMVFGAVSLASAKVIAGGFADAADNKQANQIAYLKALGVAKGDQNGNYNPDAALTRQEFVTFVARLAGQEDAAEFMAGIPSRYLDDEDIADWARGPVNLADTNGWVQGYDDGLFHPTDTLTYAQAVTVLIRVLGHEAVVTGTWPNAHIVKGINLGLNAGVSLSANTPISRADMGRLLYNALFIDQLEQTGDNKWDKAPSLMAAKTQKGKVVTITSDDIELDAQVGNPLANFEADFAEDVILIGANTLNALNGTNVRVTLNGDGEVYIVESLTSLEVGNVLTFEKFDTIAASADNNWTSSDVLVLSDGTKVKYDATATARVNGSPTYTVDGTGTNPNWDDVLEGGEWVVITTASGKVKHIDVTRFDDNNELLEADGKAKDKTSNFNRIEYDGDIVSVAGASITLNGEGAGVGDLKEDDVVAVALVYEEFDGTDWVEKDTGGSTDPANAFIAHTVVATRSTVKGEVVSNRATFPGPKVYTKVKLADGSTKEYQWVSGTQLGDAPAAGSDVTLRLNASGHIVDLYGAKAALEDGDYAVLKGASYNGSTWTVTVDVNGTEHTLNVDKNASVGSGDDIDTAMIGEAVELEMTGSVVDAANNGLANNDAGWTVDVVDTAANRVVISKGGATHILDGALTYKNDGGSPGSAVTLKKGDTVTVYHNGALSAATIKLLLKTN